MDDANAHVGYVCVCSTLKNVTKYIFFTNSYLFGYSGNRVCPSQIVFLCATII